MIFVFRGLFPFHCGVWSVISIICCGQVYTVSIEAYGGRDNKIMSQSHFRNIRSAYHPEFGESVVGVSYALINK